MTWLQSNLVNIVIILLIIALLYGCGKNCSACSIACGIETIRRQQRAARKGA